MNGYPAGFEDGLNSSDDEFIYNGEDDEIDLDLKLGFANKEPPKNIHSFVNNKDKIILEEQLSVNSEDVRVAIIQGDENFVETVLDNGFSIETQLSGGWTMLMYACSHGHIEIVKLLLKRNASPNFHKDMFTPLMAVCLSNNKNEEKLLQCIQALLDNDAKVNAHDRHLMTPLMYASKQGFSTVVKCLCANNADINKQETCGWTAICFAASRGLSHVVRVLLDFNADSNMRTYDGQFAADIAYSNGYSKLSEFLEKYDGSSTKHFDQVSQEISSLNCSSNKYVKYGDLELFLYGLELGHLVAVFQEQHLEFKDLLKMTDKELVQIGINQMGVRKKILNAVHDVHTNEWDLESLSIQNMSKLTMLESAAIIANVSKHLICIQSSVEYLHKYVLKKKQELSLESPELQKNILNQSIECAHVSESLYQNITKLNKDFKTMFPNAYKKPANLIEICKDKHSGHKGIVYIGFALVVGLTVFAGYKMIPTKLRYS